MNLTQFELRLLLVQAGFPAQGWQLPDVSYETVSEQWVTDNWDAWLEARPAELVIWGDAAGKRIRLRPLWVADACDCDNLSLGLLAHGDVGNALAVVRNGAARGGLAFGAQFFTAAQARSENFGVVGPHAINWFVNHDRVVRVFEPGVGQITDQNRIERASAWFGLAA